MYGVSTDVVVKELVQNDRIVMEWNDGSLQLEPSKFYTLTALTK